MALPLEFGPCKYCYRGDSDGIGGFRFDAGFVDELGNCGFGEDVD